MCLMQWVGHGCTCYPAMLRGPDKNNRQEHSKPTLPPADIFGSLLDDSSADEESQLHYENGHQPLLIHLHVLV